MERHRERDTGREYEEREREKERKQGVKDRMTGNRKKAGRVLMACGNSDRVFMDVYLSASPTGSSHFPFGNSWSAGKKLFMGSGKAGGQLSDRDTHIHGIKCHKSLCFH